MFVAADAADIVDGVGDVLGVDLGVFEGEAGVVDPDDVGERGVCECFAEVGCIGHVGGGDGAWDNDHGMFLDFVLGK